MALASIHGKPFYPAAYVGMDQQSVVLEAKSTKQLEDCFRKAAGSQMG